MSFGVIFFKLFFSFQVFRPIASKFGVKFDCDLKKRLEPVDFVLMKWHLVSKSLNNKDTAMPLFFCRGFFPRGGGEVVVTPSPVQSLSPVCITDPGHVTKVTINSFVAGAVPIKVRAITLYHYDVMGGGGKKRHKMNT